MQNWDQLIDQAEITLNILLPSRLKSILPASKNINGGFYFNRNLMSPPGIITPIHNKTHNRVTWAPHVHEGWYVSPEIMNYRCLASYIPKTDKYRVSYITYFSLATLPFPRMSSEDV